MEFVKNGLGARDGLESCCEEKIFKLESEWKSHSPRYFKLHTSQSVVGPQSGPMCDFSETLFQWFGFTKNNHLRVLEEITLASCDPVFLSKLYGWGKKSIEVSRLIVQLIHTINKFIADFLFLFGHIKLRYSSDF